LPGQTTAKKTAASDLTDTDTCKPRKKPHETLFAKHPMKADITETATKGQAFFPCSTDFLDFKFPKLSLKVVEEPDVGTLE